MNKKMVFFLFILVFIFCLLLIRQINITRKTTITHSETPIVESELTNIAIDKDDPSLGSPGSELLIAEFNNLDCAECQKTHDILYQFVLAHPEKTQLIWKN